MPGYCDPPEENKFKPGVSGNPNGRPKGKKNVSTQLRDIVEQNADIIFDIFGKEIPPKFKSRMTSEIIALQLVARALRGDRRAINDIMDRLEGKPVQKTETEMRVESIEVSIVDPAESKSD
jgi:hypothetical protein